MKYIIKCPYCGTTYTVDVEQQKQTFMCNSCGGQNSTEDAIEKLLHESSYYPKRKLAG